LKTTDAAMKHGSSVFGFTFILFLELGFQHKKRARKKRDLEAEKRDNRAAFVVASKQKHFVGSRDFERQEKKKNFTRPGPAVNVITKKEKHTSI